MQPFISDDKIEEIRAHCSIVSVVSGYVALKKAGRDYSGLCPFHSERTPSFTVSEDKGLFHCFGCGAGGNVFSFLSRIEGKPFPDVVRELAEREGIDIPAAEDVRRSAEEEKAEAEKTALYDVHAQAVDLYHKLLMKSEAGDAARRYLAARGLDSETARIWQLGFGGKGWSSYARTCNRGASEEAAEKAGLIIRGKKGGFYDRFRERLLFPIFDLRDRPVAFGGRILAGEGPKYMNSPESPLYTKGRLLYGLNRTKGAIREADEAILVEGYMDLLSLYRHGIKNVVATLGTALTESQALLLRRFCKRVTLFFDADEAGFKAALRGIEVLMASGIAPFVLTLSSGEDPDSFVRERGALAVAEEIQNATPALEFLLEEKIKVRKTASPADQAAIVNEIIPYIRKIEDPLERALTVRKVAERLAMDEQLILAAITGRKTSRPREVPGEAKGPSEKIRRDGAEEILLELMMDQEAIRDKVSESDLLKYFRDPQLRRLGRLIETLHQKGKEVSPAALMAAAGERELHERLSAIAMKGESLVGFPPLDIYYDCQKRLQKTWHEEEEKEVNRQLEEARLKGDDAGVLSLLKKKQQLFMGRKKVISYKENMDG